MAKTKEKDDDTIIVTEVNEGRVDAVIVGKSPLLLHRMSEKAKRELLFPWKKTAADKASSMKHNPLEEFRASAIQLPNGPTLLGFHAAGVKRAIASAALDMPGSVSKAKIGRLAWVPGEYLPVYGTPQLFMTVVRMQDMNRTPDVRTLAIVPRWAIPIQVDFVEPLLNATVVLNLLIAAGLYIGLGDGRNEKGKLSYGQFEVISTAQAQADPTLREIFRQDRKAQTAAMKNPEPYDDQARELLTWFEAETKTRGKKLIAA